VRWGTVSELPDGAVDVRNLDSESLVVEDLGGVDVPPIRGDKGQGKRLQHECDAENHKLHI
jgi:hypothetical protein